MPILQRQILLHLSSPIRRDVSFRAVALTAVIAGPCATSALAQPVAFDPLDNLPDSIFKSHALFAMRADPGVILAAPVGRNPRSVSDG